MTALLSHAVFTISSISSFPVKYIPYKATVSARTSVGEGEPSSVVFFTLEGGEGLVYVQYLILYLIIGSLQTCDLAHTVYVEIFARLNFHEFRE